MKIHIPNSISEFDLIRFLAKESELTWVYLDMEIKLNEYKKSHPNYDDKQAQAKIDIVKDHVTFLNRLEREFNIANTTKIDFMRECLMLRIKLDESQKEVDRLQNELATLKQNFST